MAPFLDKERRSNGTQGAFFGFLKYASGEIVLVVVGILIALQINDWYQERLDRKTEREYLVSMKRDLAEDTRELRAAIDGNASLLTGLDSTLRLLSEPQDNDAWRRNVYMHGLKYTYWFDVPAAAGPGRGFVHSNRGAVRNPGPGKLIHSVLSLRTCVFG